MLMPIWFAVIFRVRPRLRLQVTPWPRKICATASMGHMQPIRVMHQSWFPWLKDTIWRNMIPERLWNQFRIIRTAIITTVTIIQMRALPRTELTRPLPVTACGGLRKNSGWRLMSWRRQTAWRATISTWVRRSRSESLFNKIRITKRIKIRIRTATIMIVLSRRLRVPRHIRSSQATECGA